MDYLEKLKAFLVSVIAFLRMCPKLGMPRSQPPPPPLLPSTSSVDEPPTQPSPPTSATDPETLQLESPSSAIDVEPSRPPAQQPAQPLAPSPSTNDHETRQPESTPPPSLTTTSNPNQLETILAAQQHLQLKNLVLSFCFQYAPTFSLQYALTGHLQANHPDSSFILLSFLVLLTFNLLFVASLIRPSCTKTSEVLEKAAFLVFAAAFCHAIAIPFPFELQCTVLAVFLLSVLLITICKYLNRHNSKN